MFIEWNEDTTLLLYTKELSVTEDIFDSSVKVEFTSKINKTEMIFFNHWHDSNSLKSIILSWETKTKREFFLFEEGFPNFINIDIQGNLTSFKLKFKRCKNITRKYKIKNLLDMETLSN